MTPLRDCNVCHVLDILQVPNHKIECPECGYSDKVMIGGGHTSDLNGHFHIELAYCPSCKEPIVKRSISYSNKSDGESNTDNQVCPKCGQETVPYSILQNNVNLKCPKCNYRKLGTSYWLSCRTWHNSYILYCK